MPGKVGEHNVTKAEKVKSEEKIDKFIKGQKANQTVCKDRTDMTKLEAFSLSHSENREIQDIPPK